MKFELWVQKIADFLVAAGVAPEDGQMAALALIYLVLTFCALGIVVLLLRRNLRTQKTTVEPQEEAPLETPEAAGEAAESAEVAEPSELAPAEEVPLAAEPETVVVEEVVEKEPVSLYQRMRQGLAKTRSSLVGRMDELLGSHGRLDEEFLEEMEELLITADFGMQTTQDLVQALAGRLKEIDPNEPAQLHDVLGEEIRARLKTGSSEWPIPESGPLVIMVVGVNGVGKTTTIGKLAKQFSDQGKKVVLGAGDTFRAAAAEQLEVWGERSGAEVIRHTEGSDPGAVAFDAAKAAVAR
ncbi:MAG: signal recognition particle receptor subunit alpha, partial [Desulfuromonadales bacterium]|nr:signal recognition particle receptor subunit alpha [Desulfuromonadales bacterium]